MLRGTIEKSKVNEMRTMNTVFKLWLAALLLALGVNASGAEPAVEPQKVLMVGNSLTYTYNIPAVLERFAAETGRKLTITRHFAGGKDLIWHWTNARKPDGLSAAKAIEQGDFDLVILQDSSRRSQGQESRQDFTRITTEFHRLTKKKSMRMMFYMGFLRNVRFPEDGIQTLSDMYTKQADALDVPCAPVALAFLPSKSARSRAARQPDRCQVRLEQDGHTSVPIRNISGGVYAVCRHL